ncbi:MAG TPA: hypothetical protein VFB43_19900 [Terracidiphilus sp.]|nr:hypothetical protein [Terracidiphilus sp.]
MTSKLFPAQRKPLWSWLAAQPRIWFALLTITICSAVAHASPPQLVYVITAGAKGPQFGAVNLTNGHFLPIGKPEPALMVDLVWWKGSLLSLAQSDPYAGDLVRIDPSTGAMSVIGATGLGYNAFSIAAYGGILYLADISGNLYTVDPHTGAATFLAATGMPPDTVTPFTTNSDGTLNLCDQTFYATGGSLYVTLDAFNIDPNTLALDKDPSHISISPALYRINPATGSATLVGPTYFQFGATVALRGRFYGFRLAPTGFANGAPTAFSELFTIDASTGQPTFIRVIDPDAGTIFGAAPILP